MTHSHIEELAREAVMVLRANGASWPDWKSSESALARFAALVRNEALEEAARVCEKRAQSASTMGRQFESHDCAKAIRSLKTKP